MIYQMNRNASNLDIDVLIKSRYIVRITEDAKITTTCNHVFSYNYTVFLHLNLRAPTIAFGTPLLSLADRLWSVLVKIVLKKCFILNISNTTIFYYDVKNSFKKYFIIIFSKYFIKIFKNSKSFLKCLLKTLLNLMSLILQVTNVFILILVRIINYYIFLENSYKVYTSWCDENTCTLLSHRPDF